MKRLHQRLVLGLWAFCSLGLSPASADLEVSAAVSIRSHAEFHAPLAVHGSWVEVGRYGQCWRPAQVAVEWRPYCDGHWVWTDCGWYWASEEPWAWACYHYGSWVYEGGFGWVWVPGVEWAPAWVTWRFGSGYCGWAPLGPPGVVVAPARFVFVETHRFREPVRPGVVIVNNTTIINQTKVLNAPRPQTLALAGAAPRKVMFNEGPGLEPIAKASRQKINPLPVQDAVRQTPLPPALTRKDHRSEPEAKPPSTPAAEAGKPRTEPPAAGREHKPAPRETPSHSEQPEDRRPQRPPADQDVRPAPPHPPTPAPPPRRGQPPKGPPGKKGERGEEHGPPQKEKLL